MSYVTKNKRNVVGSIFAVIVITAIAIWQFYQFVTFKNANGIVELQGGSIHLWLAIAMALFACISGFLVFSIFLRHDTDDELHITAPPRPRRT
jgi:membrane associated rhomboid family serine protease